MITQQVLLSYGAVGPDSSIAFLQSTHDTVDRSTYTFSTQSTGSADSTRYVIVTVVGRAVAARTISSLTVGGNAATHIVTQTSGSGGNMNVIAIYNIAIPTGTTADVVVTWSGTMVRCGIGMYRALNVSAASESTGVSTANPLTSDLSASAGSVQVAAGFTEATATASWSGATEDYDFAPEAGRFSGASATTAAAGTVTPACTFSSSTNPAYVAASFAKA